MPTMNNKMQNIGQVPNYNIL